MADEYGMTSEERAGRRRMVLTVLLVALIAFFVLWYAMSYVRADGGAPSDATTASSSLETPACSIPPKKVTVNVYNATDRTGLAGRVAKELRERGFDVELVANDPKQAEVQGVGQLRHGKVTDPEARLLMKHTGKFRDVQDQRTRETVDVVLGEEFRRLVPAGQVGC